MKKVLVIVILLLTNNLFSQKTCASKEVSLEDLNSVSKCRITHRKSKKIEENKTLDVRILRNRKRFLYKKKAVAYSNLKEKQKLKKN